MTALNHVALYVRDLDGARTFYERYFGARAGELYHNPRTGLRTYFLTFDGGSRLEIMARPDVERAAEPQRLGWSHTAFTVGPKEAVDDLVRRMQMDGLTVTSGPRTTGDGYYEAVVLYPEGNQVEVVAS